VTHSQSFVAIGNKVTAKPCVTNITQRLQVFNTCIPKTTIRYIQSQCFVLYNVAMSPSFLRRQRVPLILNSAPAAPARLGLAIDKIAALAAAP